MARGERAKRATPGSIAPNPRTAQGCEELQPPLSRGSALRAQPLATNPARLRRAKRTSIFFVALVFVVAGCSRIQDTAPAAPAIPQRIISVVPSATEMLFALGVGNRVVAVGDYDHFPPEVETLPRVGGLLNPNIEKIIEMKPDLVVNYGSQDALRERLRAVGIQLYPFTHGSIDHTLEYIVELGKEVGEEKRAMEIVGGIRSTFEELRETTADTRPSVLLVHNRGAGLLGSFYSVGSKAFQHELIDIAGGKNVFADQDQEVLQPTLEEVIRRGPDIIIETIPPPATPAEIEQRRKDWESLKKLPAVVHHRVYIVAEEYMLVPGVRLNQAAKKFAALIRGALP
jgi:cobalamin transport system substrate-binding protein